MKPCNNESLLSDHCRNHDTLNETYGSNILGLLARMWHATPNIFQAKEEFKWGDPEKAILGTTHDMGEEILPEYSNFNTLTKHIFMG